MNQWFDLDALARIGLGERQRRQLLAGVAQPDARPMRVVEVQRDHWRLHDGRQTHRAACAPLLAAELQAQHEALAVGDWVLARPDGDAGWRIGWRLLPQGQITRRSTAGRAADDRPGWRRQVLVSNVDLALLVMGLDGDYNPRRLERYLALVRMAGVAPLLLLSKADTLAPPALAARLDAARALLPAGVPLLALDLRQPAAAAALAPWLAPGCTAVLLGSSGAGKSTLANTLLAAADGDPASPRRTGAVRAGDERGRHTTTVRTLLPLPGGACLIDTPGLRALRLDLPQPEALAEAFGDVAALAAQCRFRDCRHGDEPGCAVRAALSPQRLAHYHRLLGQAGCDAAQARGSAAARTPERAQREARQAERARLQQRQRDSRQRRRLLARGERWPPAGGG